MMTAQISEKLKQEIIKNELTPNIPTIKDIEDAFKVHDRKTCTCDCCIFCYMEDTKSKEEENGKKSTK